VFTSVDELVGHVTADVTDAGDEGRGLLLCMILEPIDALG
jgi:hypothetical protein